MTLAAFSLGALLSCAGSGHYVERSPADLNHALATATTLTASAGLIAAAASDASVIEGARARVMELNAFNAAVVSVIVGIREAAPRTRAVDVERLAVAEATLAAADLAFDALEAAPFTLREPQRAVVIHGGRVLDAAQELIERLNGPDPEAADLAYVAAIDTYNDWRRTTAQLAAASGPREFALWLPPTNEGALARATPGVDAPRVDDRLLASTLDAFGAEHGRGVRAAARIRDLGVGADASVAFLEAPVQ